jgi:hypothetical protein
MATDKQFTVAGVSKLDGEYKVRFANDIMRTKVLQKHGHLDIRLVDLPRAMDKYSAIEFLKTEATMQDAHAQSAIAEYLDEKAPKATKATKATKAPKAKAGTAIKAKAPAKSTKASREAAALAEAAAVARAENEDAPF